MMSEDRKSAIREIIQNAPKDSTWGIALSLLYPPEPPQDQAEVIFENAKKFIEQDRLKSLEAKGKDV